MATSPAATDVAIDAQAPIAYKNPFLWVPSSYLTMGLIYITVGAVANLVPEAGTAVDPLWTDLVADDELARAGGAAEELFCGVVVGGGAHGGFSPVLRNVVRGCGR